MGNRVGDWLGLPKQQNPAEEFIHSVNSAMGGSAVGIGGAHALAKTAAKAPLNFYPTMAAPVTPAPLSQRVGGGESVAEQLTAKPGTQLLGDMAGEMAVQMAQLAGASPLLATAAAVAGNSLAGRAVGRGDSNNHFAVNGGANGGAGRGRAREDIQPERPRKEDGEFLDGNSQQGKGDSSTQGEGVNTRDSMRDFKETLSHEETMRLHKELLAIKATKPEDFLFTPPKGDNSYVYIEKMGRNIKKDLHVDTTPVEVAPGRWSLRIDNVPARPTVEELRPQLEMMYEAWRNGKKMSIDLGIVGPDEAARIRGKGKIESLLNRHMLHTDDIKHVDLRHGTEKIKGQLNITKEDFIRYGEILLDPHSIQPGGRQGSVVYIRRYPDGTIYAVEHQIKGKRLEFTTMWKKGVNRNSDNNFVWKSF